ncbi:hypothetical protein KUCAC02_015371 [Chaenocephalus aceratus]|uniref:Uncharacterized protein n=1 Tax=Chaenocephalus aceratus TaxID=36190 RepID=A0ACB9XZ40_CHAAC|nr:hypothetical protein KUCAC02_015371 [Chaenocephalus aceratus]
MPSAQIRVIIVSGEPHFHQGLINVRIWIKINMLTAPVSPLCLFESIVFYTKRAELKVPVWMCQDAGQQRRSFSVVLLERRAMAALIQLQEGRWDP